MILTDCSGSPSLELEYTFQTTLEDYPMGYTTASFAISNDILYALNGANVGNYIQKFDLEGNYIGNDFLNVAIVQGQG